MCKMIYVNAVPARCPALAFIVINCIIKRFAITGTFERASSPAQHSRSHHTVSVSTHTNQPERAHSDDTMRISAHLDASHDHRRDTELHVAFSRRDTQ